MCTCTFNISGKVIENYKSFSYLGLIKGEVFQVILISMIFCVPWRKSLCRVMGPPHNTHSYISYQSSMIPRPTFRTVYFVLSRSIYLLLRRLLGRSSGLVLMSQSVIPFLPQIRLTLFWCKCFNWSSNQLTFQTVPHHNVFFYRQYTTVTVRRKPTAVMLDCLRDHFDGERLGSSH